MVASALGSRRASRIGTFAMWRAIVPLVLGVFFAPAASATTASFDGPSAGGANPRAQSASPAPYYTWVRLRHEYVVDTISPSEVNQATAPPGYVYDYVRYNGVPLAYEETRGHYATGSAVLSVYQRANWFWSSDGQDWSGVDVLWIATRIDGTVDSPTRPASGGEISHTFRTDAFGPGPTYTHPTSSWVRVAGPFYPEPSPLPAATQDIIRDAVSRWRAQVPGAPDYEIAGYAIADVLGGIRAIDSTDENGRNAEYALRNWIGGHLLHDPSVAPDAATLFYETVWQNPATVAVYNSRKWITERLGLGRFNEADKGHPNSDPGGFDVSVEAWNRGRQGRSLDSLFDGSPSVPDPPKTQPEEAEVPLDLGPLGIEVPHEVFALNVSSLVATLVDPPFGTAQEYRAAVGPRFATVEIPDLAEYTGSSFALMVDDEEIDLVPGIPIALADSDRPEGASSFRLLGRAGGGAAADYVVSISFMDDGAVAVSRRDRGLECDVSDESNTLTLEPGRWRMLSLPCIPPEGATIETVLGDDLAGVHAVDWTVFTYDSSLAESAYVEAELGDTLVPGEGFWIIHTGDVAATIDLPRGSREATDVRLAPSGSCGSAYDCADLTLGVPSSSGVRWNMVGNPFPASASVAFDALRIDTASGDCARPTGCTLTETAAAGVADAVLYGYDGSAYVPIGPGDDLAVWQGYWLGQGRSDDSERPVLRVPR